MSTSLVTSHPRPLDGRRPGPARTGNLIRSGAWHDGKPRFRARLRLDDGTFSDRFEVPEGLSENEAKEYVTELQHRENETRAIINAKHEGEREAAARTKQPHDFETCDAWFSRYLPSKECGNDHRRITAGIWTKWISPVIGHKSIRALHRNDVEDVRDQLDRALDSNVIRHTTARNAWATLTSALKSAYGARDRSLRVLDSPLHVGLLPPKSGDSRQRPWLYPNEWLQFVNCPDVPQTLRDTAAIALYTGLRPGELRALTWQDVDLEAGTINVSKAIEARTGRTKAPKTAHGQRVMPIQPNLAPVLERLRGQPEERVLSYSLDEYKIAVTFREGLRTAGVARPRLFADNPTEESIDFRSLRDTHATWLALAGTNDKVIQRRMGHASPTTTDRYIKAAEALDPASVGEPFPSLEPSQIELDRDLCHLTDKTPISQGFLVARVGFEPTTFGL